MTSPALNPLSPAQTLGALKTRALVFVGHGRDTLLGRLEGGYRRIDGTFETEAAAAYLLSYDGWSAASDAAERGEESVLIVTPAGQGTLVYLRTGETVGIGTMLSRYFPTRDDAMEHVEFLGLNGYTLVPDGPGFVAVWFVPLS